MQLYRKIIHPYRLINDKKENIEGYKGKWFYEECESQVRKQIYNENAEENEKLVQFCRRFGLRFEYSYAKVDFVTSTHHKIEDLKTDNI